MSRAVRGPVYVFRPCLELFLLMLPVVFLLVNPLALTILLARYLPPFLRRQRPAVGLAFGLHLVVNGRLLLFEARCLTCRERTILNAFSYALLLAPLPLVDRIVLRQRAAHRTQ